VGRTRAYPWWDQAPASTRGDPMYTTDPGTQDGVSIWHRRQSLAREGPVDATASNLDTHLDRGVGRRVRMLLSFQRPSHLFERGSFSGVRPGIPFGIPGADRQL